MSPLTDNNVFVDAVSGKVIGTENLIRDGNGVGAAGADHIPQSSTAGHVIPNPAGDEITILLDDTDGSQIPGCFGVIESKAIREVNIYNASGERVNTKIFRQFWQGTNGYIRLAAGLLFCRNLRWQTYGNSKNCDQQVSQTCLYRTPVTTATMPAWWKCHRRMVRPEHEMTLALTIVF